MHLLLACTRPHIDTAARQQIEALVRTDIDWAQVLLLAHHHRVHTLLYWRINTICPQEIPPDVRDRLRQCFHRNARRNMLLIQRLLHILDMFRAAHIAVVPYKGPVLATLAYGNLALRHAGDLDILIHEHDLAQVYALLAGQGYVSELTPEQQARHLTKFYHFRYLDLETRVLVEAHWGFTFHDRTFRLTLAHLEPRLHTIILAGRQVPTFAPEDLLLLLCVHGMKHHWERLTWVCDLAWLMVATPHLDWQQMMQRAEMLGMQRVLLVGLAMAQTLLGTHVPALVQQHIEADFLVTVLVARLSTRLMQALPPPRGPEKLHYYALMRERPGDTAFHVAHNLALPFLRGVLLPNERDYAWVRLPASLAVVYYGVHPVRAVLEHSPQLWLTLRSTLRLLADRHRRIR
jgi:hypothetical protein